MLRNIYLGANTELSGINTVIGKTDDSGLQNLITRQKQDYQKLLSVTQNLLLQKGHQPPQAYSLAQISSRLKAGIGTMRDNSPSKIVQLIIQNNTTCISDQRRCLDRYVPEDGQIYILAQTLIGITENNINELKTYLN